MLKTCTEALKTGRAAILLLPILRDDILLPFAPNFSVKFVPSRIKQLLWISPVNCPKEAEKGPQKKNSYHDFISNQIHSYGWIDFLKMPVGVEADFLELSLP